MENSYEIAQSVLIRISRADASRGAVGCEKMATRSPDVPDSIRESLDQAASKMSEPARIEGGRSEPWPGPWPTAEFITRAGIKRKCMVET